MPPPSTQQSVAVDPFLAPSAAAEIVHEMEAAPPPAFYRGIAWAMVPATALWAVLILAIRFVG